MAEGKGFEPPVPCGTTVFKTVALNRSATPPYMGNSKRKRKDKGIFYKSPLRTLWLLSITVGFSKTNQDCRRINETVKK
jgi:hypothetical protein